MAILLEKASTIYQKGQTTVPAEVRNALGVGAGDSVTFLIAGDGTVTVRKTERIEEETDPAIDAFLAFLAEDIQRRPDAIGGLTGSLERRLLELTSRTRIDRDGDRIKGDVGL